MILVFVNSHDNGECNKKLRKGRCIAEKETIVNEISLGNVTVLRLVHKCAIVSQSRMDVIDLVALICPMRHFRMGYSLTLPLYEMFEVSVDRRTHPRWHRDSLSDVRETEDHLAKSMMKVVRELMA